MLRSDAIDRSPRVTQVRTAPEWYIDADGRVEGPVSADELRDRAAGGELAPTDSVSADRVTWVPANTVPGLSFPARPRQPLLETVVSGSVHAVRSSGSDPDVVPVVTVKGYEILETLGTGACGVVYKAHQQSLNRILALKTVLMPDRATPDLLGRFQQEAKALARLTHPHIVAVYDSGECERPHGQVYFAMELLDGEDLSARIERTGPLDEQTAWMIARQTAAALAHAAKHNLIHRDVKPANLYLVTPPTGFQLPPGVPMVKVTDFGLALSRAEGDQRQSSAGTVLGTPIYMAPEQFTGSDVDIRADIYGLGCTVYHALTGAPPFDGRTVWDVMMKKSAPVPRLAPPLSPETADLVAAMLAIAPNDRPRDYAELLDRIDALPCMELAQCSVRLPTVSGRMPAAPPPETVVLTPAAAAPAPLRPKWTYALAAVILLGAGAGIAALAGAFNRPAGQHSDKSAPDRAEPTPGPIQPPGSGKRVVGGRILFAPNQPVQWTPDGGVWSLDKSEKPAVLKGSGGAVLKLDAPPSFGVTVSLDPYDATVVDVVVATTDGPLASATRWLIRLDRTDKEKATASFGKQVGPYGTFERSGTAIPLPSATELTARERGRYLEVRYERFGGKLTASFDGKPLGAVPAAGLKTTELRLQASGGPIRIDAAAIEEFSE